jgi:hypothetical protein
MKLTTPTKTLSTFEVKGPDGNQNEKPTPTPSQDSKPAPAPKPSNE